MGLCSLPLAGLAFYFLSTGLHREIDIATREHQALLHMQRAVSVLGQAIQLSWSEAGDDEALIEKLDQQISALDQQQTAVYGGAPKLSPVTLPSQQSSRSSSSDVHELWTQVRSSASGTPQRNEALQHFVSQLHENIFQASDASGLGTGPENEIGFLTDIVTVGMPLNIERLLHMHERMASDLHRKGWDATTIEVAAIFARQIEEEDAKRFARNSSSALSNDRHSAHTLTSFQQEYPRQAQDFLSKLAQFSASIRPTRSGEKPALSPEAFDRELSATFMAAITVWSTSITHLDALVTDQINEAMHHRNRALFVGAILLFSLVPLTMLYFRIFIRPIVLSMMEQTIKHQRAAEEAIEAADESNRRLRQTREALDDHCAVCVIDKTKRVLAANNRLCQLSGYAREELLDQSFSKLVSDELSSDLPQFWSAIAGGQVWYGNLCHRTAQGYLFWTDATVFPLRDRSGRPVEFIIIETDITELVQARETAEAAVKAKSRFLAMMSHEIRTPMNGVIGFANLLSETPLNEDQRDYTRAILTSGESLLVIINDILDFSKLEAGKTELDFRPMVVRSLIEDVLDLLSSQARSKGIELVYWFEPGVPECIEGDGPRLRQILLNLAGNAVKFTSKGHIEIVVESDSLPDKGRQLTFHVRDTGIGIPADRQERLFKAFSQVDTSTSRNYGGTGLGLAISRHLVELMGGSIAVESHPGQGSDFNFSIPAKEIEAPEEPPSTGPSREDLVKILRDRRILIVDDLSANQLLLENILRQYGAVPFAFHSVRKAKEFMESGSWDLAILDYLMPGESGVALAQWIRARPGTGLLPMILVASVSPEKGDIPSGLFMDVLLKPLHKQPFVIAVAHALLRGQPLPQQGSKGMALIPNADFASKYPLRILAVDDSSVNLKVITLTLGSLGYAPLVFTEAALALAALASEKIDLILMDVQMPEIDGHEATRRIRSGEIGEINRHTRIIALSAGAMEEEQAACLAAGMDGFLAKPISRKKLLEILANAPGQTKIA